MLQFLEKIHSRFENQFEFGQAYQLTSADQSQYGNFFENFSTVRTVNALLYNFIGFTPIIMEFPLASRMDLGTFGLNICHAVRKGSIATFEFQLI